MEEYKKYHFVINNEHTNIHLGNTQELNEYDDILKNWATTTDDNVKTFKDYIKDKCTDIPEKFKIGVINTSFFSYLIQIVDYESQDIIKKVIFDRYPSS